MKKQTGETQSLKLSSKFIFSIAASIQVLGLMACSPQKSVQQTKTSSTGESIVAGATVVDADPIAASTVAILIQSPEGQGLCSGTIIEKNVVLTAAHCFADGATGAVVIFGTDVEKSQIYLPVDRVIVHPEFAPKAEGEGGWNDLTLVHFVGDAPTTSKIAPFLTDASSVKKGLTGIAAGFGNTSKDGQSQDEGLLRKVTLTLQDPTYEKTELLFPLGSKGGSTCHGDSGGPVYIQQKGAIVLLGVTSRGTGAGCDNVSIFTNVSAHVDFINNSVKSLQQPQLPTADASAKK